jgi:two-component system, response regulator YesN
MPLGEPALMALTIVVVDDDVDYRMIVRYLLATVPNEMALVGEAGDSQEALSLVLRERPDVLISDVVMPGLDGVDLARRVREELPQTKIILISSHTDDAYRRLASSSGADSFINKQVLNEILLPAIRDLTGRPLSGGSGPCPGGAGASSSAAPMN